MSSRDFAGHVYRIAPGDVFSFLCHKHIGCFTHCCRELELILTPYDVLRLRYATGLSSAELHQRYIIEEFIAADVFPRFYLSMVDDGRASCVFVNDAGCSIYHDRPGACRNYPLGRGTVYDQHTGTVNEQFVLLREPHCRG
ncbi:MAG: YkgJ family cysteine cluster protein, partial [Desulfofustis sp.]